MCAWYTGFTNPGIVICIGVYTKIADELDYKITCLLKSNTKEDMPAEFALSKYMCVDFIFKVSLMHLGWMPTTYIYQHLNC